MRKLAKMVKIAASLLALSALLAGCGSPGIPKPSARQPAATAQSAQPEQTATAASAQAATAPVQTVAPPEAPSLSNLKSIAAGDGYSLAVTEDGTLLAWGDYAVKIQGEDYCFNPEEILTIDKDVSFVAAAENFCAAIKTDGTLWVWGQNKSVCGAGSPSPVKVLDGVASVSLGGTADYQDTYESMSMGGGFVLAVKTDGTLWAWGTEEFGQLSDGAKSKRLDSPTLVMEGVKKAAAGDGFSLILLKDGTLLGCGDNMSGQLLRNSDKVVTFPHNTYDFIHVQLAPVKLMDGITDMAAGAGHSLALDTDGNVWAFGFNFDGEIGDNWGENTYVGMHTEGNFYYLEVKCETPVNILSEANAIAASYDGSGAVKKDGSLWLWGGNGNHQLGDGGFENAYVPEKALEGVRLVSQSRTHTMAVKTDGTLWCWGDNRRGELGLGYCNNIVNFVKVADDVKQVSTSGKTTLIVKNDGALFGMGCNDSGQLAGASESSVSTPVLIMKDVAEAAVGDSAAFAVKTDGTLWGWGGNASGALGNGVLEDGKFQMKEENDAFLETNKPPKGYKERIVTPRKIVGPLKILDNVRHIYAYKNVTLAVKGDGVLWGWGYNEVGTSFADNSSGNTATPEKRADGISEVLCMHLLNKTDGSLYTWGNESIGDQKQTLNQSTLSGVNSAAEGATWRMAATSDGTLWAWGRFGEKEFKEPVKIEDHVKKIINGPDPLILKDDNTLYDVSGYNFEEFMKALDIGQEAHLLSGDSARKVLEGVSHAAPMLDSITFLVVKTDGSLWATGYDTYGQLGSGKVSFLPVQVSR